MLVVHVHLHHPTTDLITDPLMDSGLALLAWRTFTHSLVDAEDAVVEAGQFLMGIAKSLRDQLRLQVNILIDHLKRPERGRTDASQKVCFSLFSRLVKV